MSRFYGFNCFSLSRYDRYALDFSMPILEAREQLSSESVSTMDSEDYYQLVLRAYRDKDRAEDLTARLESNRLQYGLNAKTGLPNRENE